MEIIKELEQTLRHRDQKGFCRALKKIPNWYFLFTDHPNLQVLREERDKLEAKVKACKWQNITEKMIEDLSPTKEMIRELREGPKPRTIYEECSAFINMFRSFLIPIEDKSERKSKEQKIAFIAAYLVKHPEAKSGEIANAIGISDSNVRHYWTEARKMMGKRKRNIPLGTKRNGILEAEDISKSCQWCSAPLSSSFECSVCKEVIINECKNCHYTNTHPNYAIP